MSASFDVEYEEVRAKNGVGAGSRAAPVDVPIMVPPAFLEGRKAAAKI
jgi:hypothetical protein